MPNLFPFSFLLFVVAISSIKMTHSTPSTTTTTPSTATTPASVQIVYTERPQDQDPEAYHIRTLAAVLGSEEAAREALIYSYKTAASGFSAKLTPHQVEQISKQPGVLQVVPSRTFQLHNRPGKLN